MHILPLNIGDFSQATERFKPVHLGIFLRLLMEYYKSEKALTADRADLEWIAGVESKSEQQALDLVLRRCFVLDEGQKVWIQKRCERELENYRANGLQKRHAILCRYWDKANPGTRPPSLEEFTADPSKYYDETTRRVRVLSTRNTLVLRPYDDRDSSLPVPCYDTVTSNQKPETSNPIPPIVPKGTNTTKGPSDDSIANAIYALYPRKEARPKALQAIQKALKVTGLTELEMQGKVRAFAAAVASWPVEDRQFIPMPATWFNQHRFMDDPTSWTRHATGPSFGEKKGGGGDGFFEPEVTPRAEIEHPAPKGYEEAWAEMFDIPCPPWAGMMPEHQQRIRQKLDLKKEGGPNHA